jgi:acyl dehydratase
MERDTTSPTRLVSSWDFFDLRCMEPFASCRLDEQLDHFDAKRSRVALVSADDGAAVSSPETL